MIGVTDSSKLVELPDSKGCAYLGVYEVSLVGITEVITLADSSKLGEKKLLQEPASWDVSEWALVGIPEGAIIGTNVGIDE